MKSPKEIFSIANNKFLKNELDLIRSDVSERCICGTLKSYLEYEVKKHPKYSSYFVDVEYNRNAGRIKTIINDKHEVLNITCDLIVHSRGQSENQDNVIAIEMKKSNQPEDAKTKDRNRLIALTKSKNDSGTWSYDGKTFPQHVCGYLLGVYYEIDLENEKIILEYYCNGRLSEKVEKKFANIPKKHRLPT